MNIETSMTESSRHVWNIKFLFSNTICFLSMDIFPYLQDGWPQEANTLMTVNEVFTPKILFSISKTKEKNHGR
jgi:hypothetical protein